MYIDVFLLFERQGDSR